MQQSKACYNCKQVKAFIEFHKKASSKDGLNASCKPCRAIRAKAYRASHPDQSKKSRTWQLNNYEKHLDAQRRWREENPKYHAKWRDDNKELDLARSRQKRARRVNAQTSFYLESEVLSLYGTSCYLCKLPIDLSAPRQSGKLGWELGLHIDHVVAIINGGADSIENVRPSHGKCNLSKNAQSLEAYLKR